MVSCHNKLHDVFVDCCRRANVSAQVQVAVVLGMTNATPDQQMLTLLFLSEAGVTTGSAALVAEYRKHDLNDPKCSELG